MTTAPQHADALVFFGATGDLAYKKIFPALYAMTKRGHLGIPVIGVASSSWSVDDLRKRAHDIIETFTRRQRFGCHQEPRGNDQR